ncbi:MAG: hypothetical protein LC730_00530 [Acidobacteria bacterium]|nr:hypothetical protein [Acidobacteriota bacterium]
MEHRLIDLQLDVLRDKILLLGGATESAVQRAMQSFVSEDAEVSRAIIQRDREIDKAYHRVFNELLQLMIEIPSASTGAAHLLFVAKHLERIGDYVKDICELIVYLREAAFIKHSISR